MNFIGRLQQVCDAFCAASERTQKQASYQIFKDQRRLDVVFLGDAGLSVESLERAFQWFSDNWPDGATWPADVERPSRSTAMEAAE